MSCGRGRPPLAVMVLAARGVIVAVPTIVVSLIQGSFATTGSRS